MWEEPKKVQLSSPEAVAALDFSEEALEGGCVAQWKADVPDCFYGLQLEPWQRPYAVLGDLRFKDLDEFLEWLGEEKTGWDPEDWLAMDGFCMGWSWAVWGAETTLEDICTRGCEIQAASSRLRYGAPTPRIGPELPPPCLTHIDDLGG